MIPRSCLDLVNLLETNIEYASVNMHFVPNETAKAKLLGLVNQLNKTIEEFKLAEKEILKERV
jgi:hypothetical protein